MTVCDQLRPNAAGVASLPEGDPERIEYLAHAQGCPGCMAAFRQGEALMRKLDAVELPAPSPAALDRTRAAVLAEMQTARAPWWLNAAAAIGAFFVPVFFARRLQLAGLAFSALVLAAATVLAATAGALRSGVLIVLAASAGFAFAAGGVPGMPQVKDFALIEFTCGGRELLAAALPLAAAAWAFRKNPRPGALAQAAAAGALAGQAALHLSCPARNDAVHLWSFHVAGVMVAALIGWIAESQLKSARN